MINKKSSHCRFTIKKTSEFHIKNIHLLGFLLICNVHHIVHDKSTQCKIDKGKHSVELAIRNIFFYHSNEFSCFLKQIIDRLQNEPYATRV